MRTLEEAKNYFAFHPATAEAAVKYDRIRRAYLAIVDVLWAELPDGPDKTTALRQLHLASMLSIGAVAVNDTPADYDNPQVARVLPDTVVDTRRCPKYFHPDAQCDKHAGHSGSHTALNGSSHVGVVW